MLIFKCVILILYFESFVAPKISDNVVQDHCAGKQTCHQCIQAKDCAWCMDPNASDAKRCFHAASNSSCQQNFIWNPQATQELIDDRELTVADFNRTTNTQDDDIVQIRPQRIKLKLRISKFSKTISYVGII